MGRAKVTCTIVERQGTCSRLPEVFNPVADKTARIAKGGWSTGWVHSRWWLRLRRVCQRVLAGEVPQRVGRPSHDGVSSRESPCFAAQFAGVRVLAYGSIGEGIHEVDHFNTSSRLYPIVVICYDGKKVTAQHEIHQLVLIHPDEPVGRQHRAFLASNVCGRPCSPYRASGTILPRSAPCTVSLGGPWIRHPNPEQKSRLAAPRRTALDHVEAGALLSLYDSDRHRRGGLGARI